MMPPIPYHEVHGSVPRAAASWDTRPPDLGQVLTAVEDLRRVGDELDNARDAEVWGRLVDQQAAELVAWQLRQPRYDPAAPPPMSEAERRRRELADLDVIRAMRG